MVQAHVRQQRYHPAVRYTGDKGWKMPVPGMYERRYSPTVYGNAFQEHDRQWHWMLYVKDGPTIASGYAGTSTDARKATNEAWYSYERRRGSEWPPEDNYYRYVSRRP